MRKHAVTLVALLLPLLIAPHAQAVEYHYASFYEDSVSANYRGATGHWTDTVWTGMQCSGSNINFMATVVNAFGRTDPINTWVQMGFMQRKVPTLEPDACTTDIKYYWEWNSLTGYNIGWITNPSPRGTHSFTVVRLTTGCAGGITWCWHQQIDGSTKHTCCGNVTEFSPADDLSIYVECQDAVINGDCAAVGIEDPMDGFRYKNTSDLWYDWAGKDLACVDYDASARGKWISDTSAKGGFNVGISGSINGCV